MERVGVDEIEPLPEAPVAPLERNERRLVAVVDLENLLEARRGEVGLEKLLFLDGSELHQSLDTLALTGYDVELLLEDADQLGPTRLLGVDPLETAHRRQRSSVDLEDLTVSLRGLVGILEAVFVELGHPQLVGGNGLVVAQGLDLAAEHVDELAIHGTSGVDALESFEGRQVERIDFEGTGVVAKSLIDFVHLPLEELAQVGEDLLAVGVGRGHVEGAGQSLTVLLPLGVLAVETAHLSQNGNVVRVQLNDLRVVRLGIFGVPEVFAVPLGKAEAETDALLGIFLALQPGVGVLDELAPAARRLGHALEVLRGFTIRIVDGEGVDQGVECLSLVVELLFEHLRDSAQDVGSLGRLFARVESPEVELDEWLPARSRVVELLQGVVRAVVRRIDGEDLLVRFGTAVLVVDLLIPNVCHLQELADFVLCLGQGVGALHLDRNDVRPLRLAAVDRLERIHGLEVARIDVEELAPGVGGLELLSENFAVGLS